jgi:hypothetical protein
MLHTGKQPTQLICHTCDRPACCNPGHLFEDTQLGNIQDMIAKGRKTQVRGERNGIAKLTVRDVLDIRAAGAAGESQRSIASRKHVSAGSVTKILNGTSWRHVKP